MTFNEHDYHIIIEAVVTKTKSTQVQAELLEEALQEVSTENERLQAEMSGMQAGARLDNYVAEAAQGVNALLPQFTTLGSNLAEEMANWQSELAALLQSHASVGSVDIDTVSTYLRPFQIRVASWRESIETIINNSANQEA